jgi:hypothetical protein
MVHPLPKTDGFPRFGVLYWIWGGYFICRLDAVSDAIPQAQPHVSPVWVRVGGPSTARAGLAHMEMLPRLRIEDD